MLQESHVQPLSKYVGRLRELGFGEVPDFDPLDGGIKAKILFLFEKSGPQTAVEGGSGFISRNNDDPTAEATFNFMEQAGIPRKDTVTWNLVPWWNGERKVTSQELNRGLAHLSELLMLLPNLQAVVLVGKNAARAASCLEKKHPGIQVFRSDHPSPLVRANFPDRWKVIPNVWAEVMSFIIRDE